MATLKTAVPVSRDQAHAALKGSYAILSKAGNEARPEKLLQELGTLYYDWWENSTTRKGVRTYRLRIMASETQPTGYDPKAPNPCQRYIDLMHKVAEPIIAKVQETLPPEAYHIMKFKASKKFVPHITILIFYSSGSGTPKPPHRFSEQQLHIFRVDPALYEQYGRAKGLWVEGESGKYIPSYQGVSKWQSKEIYHVEDIAGPFKSLRSFIKKMEELEPDPKPQSDFRYR